MSLETFENFLCVDAYDGCDNFIKEALKNGKYLKCIYDNEIFFIYAYNPFNYSYKLFNYNNHGLDNVLRKELILETIEKDKSIFYNLDIDTLLQCDDKLYYFKEVKDNKIFVYSNGKTSKTNDGYECLCSINDECFIKGIRILK